MITQIDALLYKGFLLTRTILQQIPWLVPLGKLCNLAITLLLAVSQSAVHFAECANKCWLSGEVCPQQGMWDLHRIINTDLKWK